MNQHQSVQLEQLAQRFGQFVLKVHVLMDQYPLVTWAVGIGLVLFIVWKWRQQRAQAANFSGVATTQRASRLATGLLSQVLFWFSPRDPLRISDLLRSIAILGASGSGKTSGAGYQLAKALVGNRKIGGLILASKPEDLSFWRGVFKKAGRKRDLLVFGPHSPLRFNFLDYLQKTGCDTREITEAIMTIAETLEQKETGGGEDGQFWKREQARMIYNAIEVLRLAQGKVTAPDIQRFISGAATSPEMQGKDEWRKGFHNRCMETAFNRKKTPLQEHDYQLALDYWLNEYPSMADRTRSSILVGVMGTLHVFNTGMVRELVSTTTNVSPAVIEERKWVLVDMPISTYGASGAFCVGGWKYLMQKHILMRHATEKTPVCVIWADEAQKVMNSRDIGFLAECRSHRGCMVYLTQSIHSFYARLGGRGGEHEADAMLTNFYHKIFHAVGDDKTAAFGSGLVGRRLTTRMGGSMGAGESVGEELFGKGSRYSANFSESVEQVLENREFMQGLRTGGPQNGYIVDGIVVRSGEPFSNGEAWLRVSFSQR